MASLVVLFATMTSCVAPEVPEAALDVGGGGDVVVTQHHALGVDYLEVVPRAYDGRSPLPMVVHLHGRGGRPRVPNGSFLGIDAPVRLILPRAPTPLGDGYTWLPVSAKRGESEALVSSLRRTSAKLANVLEALVDRHPTLGRPIVAGFSQGGMLTFALAVHHPDVVGVAFPVAGWLPPTLVRAASESPHVRRPAIRAIHGTRDPILPVERTRDAARALTAHGIDVELHEYDAPHEMSHDMRERLKKWIEAEVRAHLDEGRRARGAEA